MKKTKKPSKRTKFVPARSPKARAKQKAAIRKYYTEKKPKESALSKLVSVLLKKHRDKNGGHHHVILEDIEDKHVSVGLTTDFKKGKNSTNYDCRGDVLGNGKASYMRRQGTVDFQENYFNPRHGKMTEEAYAQAKVYGERAKQKYFEKKKR